MRRTQCPYWSVPAPVPNPNLMKYQTNPNQVTFYKITGPLSSKCPGREDKRKTKTEAGAGRVKRRESRKAAGDLGLHRGAHILTTQDK